MNIKNCRKCNIEKEISYFIRRNVEYLSCDICSEKEIIKERKRSSNPDRIKYKSNYAKRDACKSARSKRDKKNKVNYPWEYLFEYAKRRAKVKLLDFNLTKEYLESIFPKDFICPVLNIKLEINNGYVKDSSPTLDRIDSNKGYIIGNVCIISARANRIKNDANLEELKAVCRYIESYEENIRV